MSEILTSMDFKHSITVHFQNSLDFRHIRVSEIRTHKISDFRQVQRISGVRIADLYCSDIWDQIKAIFARYTKKLLSNCLVCWLNFLEDLFSLVYYLFPGKVDVLALSESGAYCKSGIQNFIFDCEGSGFFCGGEGNLGY